MKIGMIAMLLTVMGIQSVLACSPPRTRYAIQGTQLNKLTEDRDVQKRIYELVKEACVVKSIVFENNLYTVTISDGCSFTAKPIYTKPPSNGMCPGWGGFELSETVCP